MLRRILLAAIAASFFVPATAHASSVPGPTGGNFIVRCNYVRSLQVDPIVSPGIFPSAHLHDFFGNTGIDQNSTPDSVRGGGTLCKLTSDTAGYWVPAAYRTDTGAQVVPKFTYAYYFGTSGETVSHLPAGLEMVAGNSHATAPQSRFQVAWSCGNGNGSSPSLDHPYNCTDPTYGVTSKAGVVAIVKFPFCWDGTGLAPSDVAYGAEKTGVCPAGFPVKLPQVQIHEHFGPTFLRGDLLTLASGPFYTEHGDWMNAWNQTKLDSLTDGCLNAHVDCGLLTDASPGPSVAARATACTVAGKIPVRSAQGFLSAHYGVNCAGSQAWTVDATVQALVSGAWQRAANTDVSTVSSAGDATVTAPVESGQWACVSGRSYRTHAVLRNGNSDNSAATTLC